MINKNLNPSVWIGVVRSLCIISLGGAFALYSSEEDLTKSSSSASSSPAPAARSSSSNTVENNLWPTVAEYSSSTDNANLRSITLDEIKQLLIEAFAQYQEDNGLRDSSPMGLVVRTLTQKGINRIKVTADQVHRADVLMLNGFFEENPGCKLEVNFGEAKHTGDCFGQHELPVSVRELSIVGSKLTKIDGSFCMNHQKLTSVNITNNVTIIDGGMFCYGCHELTHLNISSVRSIGPGFCGDCPKLTSMTIACDSLEQLKKLQEENELPANIHYNFK